MRNLLIITIIFFTLVSLQLNNSELYSKNQAIGFVTETIDLTEQLDRGETKLWLPYPLSDENQIISEISVTGDFDESAVYSDQKFKSTILFAKWNKDATSRKLTFKYKVTRNEVIIKNLPVKEDSWNKKDLSVYLEETRLGPIDGKVGELAKKITAGKKTTLEKARAIYDWTCENMYREPTTQGCGIGDVNSLLDTFGGKCADIHSVYVALCRSAEVPAREVWGSRLGKKEKQDITGWQHCWAEFFLPGTGWIPVDPGDVRKLMLKRDLQLGDMGTQKLRDYFWGGIDEFRYVMSYGRDLILNPEQSSNSLNYLMYPFAEIDGKALDFHDPKNFKYKRIAKRIL